MAALMDRILESADEQLTGDAKYADVIELATYNGILSGISLSGDKFYYVNPLASAARITGSAGTTAPAARRISSAISRRCRAHLRDARQ